VSALIANARMYAVTPAVEAAWRALFQRVAATSGVALDYLAHPAPAPLDDIWARPDLGLALQCGWPFANLYPAMRPVAAPVPRANWAGGGPRYRTHLVARADRPVPDLDRPGLRLGWTATHSQSGRHAVEAHRAARGRPRDPVLVGPLVTPRCVVEAVLAGEVDLGPLDSYWHALLAAHEPQTAARLRVVETTELTPMPLLVASPEVEPATVDRLGAALVALGADEPRLAPLELAGFARVTRADYDALRSIG